MTVRRTKRVAAACGWWLRHFVAGGGAAGFAVGASLMENIPACPVNDGHAPWCTRAMVPMNAAACEGCWYPLLARASHVRASVSRARGAPGAPEAARSHRCERWTTTLVLAIATLGLAFLAANAAFDLDHWWQADWLQVGGRRIVLWAAW